MKKNANEKEISLKKTVYNDLNEIQRGNGKDALEAHGSIPYWLL